MDLTTVLIAILTLAAGLGAGLAIGRSSGTAATAERDAARTDAAQLRAQATALSDRATRAETDAARLGASLQHEQHGAEELRRSIDQIRDEARAELHRAEQNEQRLREAFSALSREALQQTSKDFMSMAEQRLKQAGVAADGELAKRQQAIEGLVSPLKTTLDKVEAQIQSVERERVGSHRALLEQVGTMRQASEGLQQETKQLVTALRAPQVRGRWGEMQLEQIVRNAGMVEHCDFETQQSTAGEDGVLRPDLVVRLAGEKNIVVDAKVSFVGFLEAMEAKDDATRSARLKAHARHLRTHIDQLAAKAYWQRFDPTPEFVVMFVPAEVFLNAALDEDPSLLEHGFERNVVIATPSTLIALLRTVAYTWRQEALAANANKIHLLGKELHGRLATMGGHIGKLGTQLEKAVKSYNSTVSSLESRVLVSARKLTELQVSDEEIIAPEQLTEVPRQLQAPELVASANDSLVALQRDTGQERLDFGRNDPMPRDWPQYGNPERRSSKSRAAGEK